MKLKNKLIPLASVITAAAAVVPLTVSCGTNTKDDDGFVDLTEAYGTKLGFLDCTDDGVNDFEATEMYAEALVDNPEIFVEDYLWGYSTQISDIQDKQKEIHDNPWIVGPAIKPGGQEPLVVPTEWKDKKKEAEPAKPRTNPSTPEGLFEYKSDNRDASDEEVLEMYKAAHIIAEAYDEIASSSESAVISKDDKEPFIGNAQEHKVRFSNVTADSYEYYEEKISDDVIIPVISFDIDYTIFYTYDDVVQLGATFEKREGGKISQFLPDPQMEELTKIDRTVAMVEEGTIQFKDIPFRVIWNEVDDYYSWIVRPFIDLVLNLDEFSDYTATFTPEVVLNYGVATQNYKFSTLGTMQYVTNSDYNFIIDEDSLQGEDGQKYAGMFIETCKTFSPMSHYLLTLPCDML